MVAFKGMLLSSAKTAICLWHPSVGRSVCGKVVSVR